MVTDSPGQARRPAGDLAAIGVRRSNRHGVRTPSTHIARSAAVGPPLPGPAASIECATAIRPRTPSPTAAGSRVRAPRRAGPQLNHSRASRDERRRPTGLRRPDGARSTAWGSPDSMPIRRGRQDPGHSAPCNPARHRAHLPVACYMQFDIPDLAGLATAGQLDKLILHEMAHVWLRHHLEFKSRQRLRPQPPSCCARHDPSLHRAGCDEPLFGMSSVLGFRHRAAGGG